MTKEELLKRLSDIEWDDFECKEALNKLPDSVWETVSAFSNTSGGWIVLGIKQNGKRFDIQGVSDGEKMESDFLNVLHGGQKFNMRLTAKGLEYNFDGKTVLAFHVPSSPIKPVYSKNPSNTFIRSGSGDRRATEGEVMAMMRDQAFGSKSETQVTGTSISDLNIGSLETFRNHVAFENPEFLYNGLPLEEYCEKLNITSDGLLTYAGLLMFGERDALRHYIPNFWIDYIEVPGTSYSDASVRYTYRMPEMDNIWEAYRVIVQRLRIYCDAPYKALPNGIGAEDNSQLYALREGLINFCAHADYFSPMHPTIRVYSDRIEFQNPGRFMFPLDELLTKIHSMPRNPSIIKFFRYAKLSENAGYGIDKMMRWQQLTGGKVEFDTTLVSSTITYWFGKRLREQVGEQARDQVNITDIQSIDGFGGIDGEQASEQVGEQAGEQVNQTDSQENSEVRGTDRGIASEQASEQVQMLVNAIREDTVTMFMIQKRLNIASRSFIQMKMLKPAIAQGYVLRAFPDKPSHPKQRYYLSEKGLKLVK